MSANLDDIGAVLVLRPGDKLLFHLTSTNAWEVAVDVEKRAKEIWPDVPIMVVHGDISVHIVRVEEGAK